MGQSTTDQLRIVELDSFFLAERLAEGRRIISEVAQKTEAPLIVNFSGGKDSMALLGLVREITDNFVCAYMSSGMEFDDVVPFVKRTCDQLGVKLLISTPDMYKGDFFERLEKFRVFPGLWGWDEGGKSQSGWCNRDLKLRPQKAMLRKIYGKKTPLYKLIAVRRNESARRKALYGDYIQSMIAPDEEHRGSFKVLPLLSWTKVDVLNYLEMLKLPTTPLYKKYGVSGCYWCPYYEPSIYLRVLADNPNMYDRFIEWEEKLGKPSVIGEIYLGDLKREIIDRKLF